MKNNRERINYFRTHSSLTPDHPYYKALLEYHERRIEGNFKLKKSIEKASSKAINLRLTQSKNGIGLLQDTELRYFLDEYNSRIWDFGLGSTPSSINVLEGFFIWNADLFYFQLLEEEEHLFSFFDFLDFVTSDDCSNSIDYFTQNAQEDLIYSYNLLNEVTDLTFKTNDSKEYVVGGVSLIKRGNEAFILMVAGELANVDHVTSGLEDYEPDKKRRWYIRPDKSRKQEAIGLMDRKDIWKVNIYARIDLESKSIDSRYVQKDEGNRFSTITDDVDMLRKSIPDEKLFMQAMEQNLAEIANYDAIFEIAYKSLHLPEYFDFNDQDIVCEEHPTGLFAEKATYPSRKKNSYISEYFYTTKDVWVLDKNQNNLNKRSIANQDELVIQKDGYWQRLSPGKLGRDKNGNLIHNRTWIEKTLSWYETKNSASASVKISTPGQSTKGYIYILRNPSHSIDLFKIGLTTKTVEDRAGQLSGTGSPDKFLIVQRWQVNNCQKAEKLIHKQLEQYRLNPKREFFKITLEQAIEAISPIIKEINSGTHT